MDSTVLYVSEATYALLLVKAANFYVTNSTRTATFHGPLFYSAFRTILVELHDLYRNYAADMYQKVRVFMTVKLQGLSRTSSSM